MLAQFSVIPIGAGNSISKQVAEVLDVIDSSGISYKITAMGTIVEGDWDEIMSLLKKCRDAAMKKCKRIIITISIDERIDGRTNRIEGKVSAVERHLGKSLKK
jgi:uncharacterized protein (TIGR00106 family)